MGSTTNVKMAKKPTRSISAGAIYVFDTPSKDKYLCFTTNTLHSRFKGQAGTEELFQGIDDLFFFTFSFNPPTQKDLKQGIQLWMYCNKSNEKERIAAVNAINSSGVKVGNLAAIDTRNYKLLFNKEIKKSADFVEFLEKDLPALEKALYTL